MNCQILLLILLIGVVSMEDKAESAKKGNKKLEKRLEKLAKCMVEYGEKLASSLPLPADISKLQDNSFSLADILEMVNKTSSGISAGYAILKCYGNVKKFSKEACKDKETITSAASNSEFMDELCKADSTVGKTLHCLVKRDYKIPESCIKETGKDAYDDLLEEANKDKSGPEKLDVIIYQVACSDCLNGFDRIVKNCNKKLACSYKKYRATKLSQACDGNIPSTEICKKFD